MTKLEDVVLKIVRNLKRTKTIEGIILSKSRRKSLGIELSKVNEKELKHYIQKLGFVTYFHNIGSAKYSWYQINGLMKPAINRVVIELCKIIPYTPIFDRDILYKALGIKIGKNTSVAPFVKFDYFHPKLIEIGDKCLIGEGAKIWAHEYGLDYFMIGSVEIGDNVKVGTESTIGPCVIGNNVEMDAGALVYGRIPSNSKVYGAERSKCVKWKPKN